MGLIQLLTPIRMLAAPTPTPLIAPIRTRTDRMAIHTLAFMGAIGAAGDMATATGPIIAATIPTDTHLAVVMAMDIAAAALMDTGVDTRPDIVALMPVEAATPVEVVTPIAAAIPSATAVAADSPDMREALAEATAVDSVAATAAAGTANTVLTYPVFLIHCWTNARYPVCRSI